MGDRFLIYNSRWTPRPSTFRPISPQTLSPNSTVSDLYSGWWHLEWTYYNEPFYYWGCWKSCTENATASKANWWSIVMVLQVGIYHLALILKEPNIASSFSKSSGWWKFAWSLSLYHCQQIMNDSLCPRCGFSRADGGQIKYVMTQPI